MVLCPHVPACHHGDPTVGGVDSEPRSRVTAVRALRVTGWALLAAGGVVALYLVYSLFFTNFTTNQAQSDLRQQWQEQVGDGSAADEHGTAQHDAEAERDRLASTAERADAEADFGGAVAMLEFDRPGDDEPVVHADPLFVVENVRLPTLRRGPGHYPSSAPPGEEGNFAVAGHRTTYGAPFLHLDELRPGDEVHVTDREGKRHTYEVAEQRVVGPDARWVVGSDPLDGDAPTLTLTTCHPRFSAAKRLVVFAELS